MDFKKLTRGEMIVVIAGVLLFIDSFLDWYSVDIGPLSFGFSGWDKPGAIWSILAALIGLVMAAQVIASRLFNVSMPDKVGNFGWGFVHMILGIAAFVFVVIKLLNESSSMAVGFYLGIILSAALAVGGFLMAKERGELPAQLGGSTAPPAA